MAWTAVSGAFLAPRTQQIIAGVERVLCRGDPAPDSPPHLLLSYGE